MSIKIELHTDIAEESQKFKKHLLGNNGNAIHY